MNLSKCNSFRVFVLDSFVSQLLRVTCTFRLFNGTSSRYSQKILNTMLFAAVIDNLLIIAYSRLWQRMRSY